MRTIALYAGILRALTLVAGLTICALPAAAQLANPTGSPGGASGVPAAAPESTPAPLIRRITVTGTQRVEPQTVISYITLREGDAYSEAQADAALQALFATGLFSDVHIDFDGATLFIRVTENPIVNQVVFEGNSKVSSKDLTAEVQIKPRAVFTRAKVQSDVQRIIEVYRRNGKFAATVNPEIIQRSDNRVDLIFSITEGPTTNVSRINFIGNKVFDSDTLKGQISTEESAWYKFLASNDNYDPDRLTFDREQLSRYYNSHGYADFEVLSAVAELTPDREHFYITFTVSEGPRYKFGNVTIQSAIKDLDSKALRPLVDIKSGDTYNSELVEKAIDALTNAAGTKGYAFAQVHPRLQRNLATRTIDLTFQIDEGPRVYIEKINIVGNSVTLDKVVRREFRLVEGDAFNRVLVDRSRTRIRALGFFADVNIKDAPGSEPDKTDLTVTVTEQSTGSVSLGLGYSSVSQLVGEFSYTQQNLFGRGEFLEATLQASQISKQAQLSFTEPSFHDRDGLAVGFDIYKTLTQYEQASYQSDVTAGVLRMGFPVSEFGTASFNYSYDIENIEALGSAPVDIAQTAGKHNGSVVGFGYAYNTLDDQRTPTTGFTASFTQSFAGFGGNLKYIKSTASFSTYHPFFDEDIIASLQANAGYITGYSGNILPAQERFFSGANTFRGFAIAGVGPRDTAVARDFGGLGEDAFAIGTLAARLPKLLPPSYGVNLGVFTDFGTVGHLDDVSRVCTITTCVKDNLAFRATAGISMQWRSPFGPIQISLAMPYVKTKYDRPQILYFSSGTGL